MEPCLICGLHGAGWNTDGSSTNRACRSQETFICFTLKSFFLAAGWGMDCDRTRVMAGTNRRTLQLCQVTRSGALESEKAEGLKGVVVEKWAGLNCWILLVIGCLCLG